MQTLQTGTRNGESWAGIAKPEKTPACNPEYRARSLGSAGFTILELIAVMFIISLSLFLVMPSLMETEKGALKTEAKHISSTIRYIYNEAIGKRQTYLFTVDLDNKSWSFKSKEESRSFSIKDNIAIKDVFLPSLGEISSGEAVVEFGPLGPEEPLILHLARGNSEYTIIFNHLNGKIKIIEGYKL